MPGHVSSEIERRIGWIVIDHPERRNALSAHIGPELAPAGERLAADESLRSVERIAGELRKAPSARNLGAVDKALAACFHSEEFQEGMKAFLEKRLPDFQGR